MEQSYHWMVVFLFGSSKAVVCEVFFLIAKISRQFSNVLWSEWWVDSCWFWEGASFGRWWCAWESALADSLLIISWMQKEIDRFFVLLLIWQEQTNVLKTHLLVRQVSVFSVKNSKIGVDYHSQYQPIRVSNVLWTRRTDAIYSILVFKFVLQLEDW